VWAGISGASFRGPIRAFRARWARELSGWVCDWVGLDIFDNPDVLIPSFASLTHLNMRQQATQRNRTKHNHEGYMFRLTTTPTSSVLLLPHITRPQAHWHKEHFICCLVGPDVKHSLTLPSPLALASTPYYRSGDTSQQPAPSLAHIGLWTGPESPGNCPTSLSVLRG